MQKNKEEVAHVSSHHFAAAVGVGGGRIDLGYAQDAPLHRRCLAHSVRYYRFSSLDHDMCF